MLHYIPLSLGTVNDQNGGICESHPYFFELLRFVIHLNVSKLCSFAREEFIPRYDLAILLLPHVFW